MSSPSQQQPPQVPPWLQSEIAKLQQSQQNLQSVMAQIQHTGMEKAETDKAIEELNKAADDETVFKHAGTILIKSTKPKLVGELEERNEMAKTRLTVLEKQAARLKESLAEQEKKIAGMMKGGGPATTGTAHPSPDSIRPAENPRK